MSRAHAHAVIVEDDLRIPSDAFTFAGFRRWVASGAFPESGRIDFLAGAIEVDMSAENLLTHGLVKSEIVGVFQDLITHRNLGQVFTDRSRVASRFAQLSVEPDVVVVLFESIPHFRCQSIRHPRRVLRGLGVALRHLQSAKAGREVGSALA